MDNLTSEERVAKCLFDVKAVKINVKNPFTFASGIKSPIYCDNRYILGHNYERDIIIEEFVKSVDEEIDVIVGVATAGIPWASIIADRMNKPLAYVRNKPKEHGAGKQIEGAEVKGKKILLIEDLITTGKSSLIAVSVLQREYVASIEVKSIFSYGFKSATENYGEYNCKFTSLSNFSTLIEMLKRDNYLTEEEAKEALNWSLDPQKWGKDIDENEIDSSVIPEEILEKKVKSVDKKLEKEEKTVEEYYTMEEYEKIINRRKWIIGGMVLIIFFIAYNFFMFQNRKIETEKIIGDRIEKIEMEIRERATKEAEAKAKMEMELRLQEEIEKIKIEEAGKRVVKDSQLNKILDDLPKGEELEKLVKEAKKTGKTIEELIAEKDKIEEEASSFGENINKFIMGVYDFFSGLFSKDEE